MQHLLISVVIWLIVAWMVSSIWRCHKSRKFEVIDMHDAKKADEILQTLDAYAVSVVAKLRSAYDGGSVSPDKYRYFVYAVINRYDGRKLAESAPNGIDTSYVTDKSRSLHLCLRDAGYNFHDIETLKYVLLHEMSHMGTIEVEHSVEFTNNFRWLLHFLVERGLYVPVDYARMPVFYCNKINLNTNQYYN